MYYKTNSYSKFSDNAAELESIKVDADTGAILDDQQKAFPEEILEKRKELQSLAKNQKKERASANHKFEAQLLERPSIFSTASHSAETRTSPASSVSRTSSPDRESTTRRPSQAAGEKSISSRSRPDNSDDSDTDDSNANVGSIADAHSLHKRKRNEESESNGDDEGTRKVRRGLTKISHGGEAMTISDTTSGEESDDESAPRTCRCSECPLSKISEGM